MGKKSESPYLNKTHQAATLAVFRIVFGLMMAFGMLRFLAYGWVEKLYLTPKLHFSYYGFDWVQPIGNATYALFIVCTLAALMIAFGFQYRIAAITFFLSFTYIELMDKTTYLNHYYFISLVAFLLIFLPANTYFSIDARNSPEKEREFVPKWTVDALKLMLGIVYFYAGLAKLNSDWLVDALPLRIWLSTKVDVPLVGAFVNETWVAYAFSWIGAIYDLSIPFLLLWSRTRKWAFALVVIFHVLTWMLFPIGMFPFIMIGATLIFFPGDWHKKLLRIIGSWLNNRSVNWNNGKTYDYSTAVKPMVLSLFALFFMVQLLLPFRYLAYPGELFWTEEGFRFSWRVMLMEKAGYAQFKIVNEKTGKWFYVDNADFLTPFQEKQMGFQPDFILEYAHWLGKHFESQGHKNVGVYVESHVSLNGRAGRPMVDPKVDLMKQTESFKSKKWILPFNDTIYGL